jgi:uncharacterized protein YoxC|tara:strand:- start:942 stop:1193 length:252 start_codon:yes stop_codon:yes gene_type:complete
MNAILITSTLLIISAIVLVVAFHLIGIFWYLKKTGDNLENLAGGLIQISANTNPLESNIDDLNEGLNVLISNFITTLKNLKFM